MPKLTDVTVHNNKIVWAIQRRLLDDSSTTITSRDSSFASFILLCRARRFFFHPPREAVRRIKHRGSIFVASDKLPGAIIRDGDRKSWDARGPMIWDNFSIFRTNCAILTSYIRADPRTCLGLSRGC